MANVWRMSCGPPARLIVALAAVRSIRLFESCRLQLRSYPHPSRGDHSERALHLVSMLSKRRRNEIRLLSGRETSEPYQENTRGHTPKAEHEFTEVLVDGDENPPRGIGTVEDLVVGGARPKLSDVVDVVTVIAQAPDDRGVDALVREQPHATDLGSG